MSAYIIPKKVLLREDITLSMKIGHQAKALKSSNSPSVTGENYLIEFENGARAWLPESILIFTEKDEAEKSQQQQITLKNPIHSTVVKTIDGEFRCRCINGNHYHE